METSASVAGAGAGVSDAGVVPAPTGHATSAHRRGLLRRLAWQAPLTLILAAAVLVASGVRLTTIPAIALAAVAAELARIDATEHRLPNRLTVPVIGLGVAALGIRVALGDVSIGAITTIAIITAVVLLLGLLGAFGMGDAKLVIAMALAGPTALVTIAAPVLGTLLGGAAAVVVLVRSGRGRRLPLGPFLLGGWGLALGAQLLLAAVR
ncbi:leader peptidase (prepilin peptidase)/N-methyltransferase [Schumannella luteola]|uniref:Leader peptidase (Prepilin peptidase)/N-methyltransferase n=1 Tax=Schumannella luteola TaxID=472059 RepID=A0A852YJU7_9MICO|nr:leader peptidase (prepilin peptidase)/N-methyltransferase [Schumannella luteola]